MLYSTILYYTILYYTILYYTILYYTILYYTILYYTILYYTMLYYTILYYTILCYTILYYTILYYTILYYTILYYTILYYTIPYCNIIYYTKQGAPNTVTEGTDGPHEVRQGVVRRGPETPVDALLVHERPYRLLIRFPLKRSFKGDVGPHTGYLGPWRLEGPWGTSGSFPTLLFPKMVELYTGTHVIVYKIGTCTMVTALRRIPICFLESLA